MPRCKENKKKLFRSPASFANQENDGWIIAGVVWVVVVVVVVVGY
jgi:hypothetical protein